ncbi:MAG: MFS transporter, partial [archaeon]
MSAIRRSLEDVRRFDRSVYVVAAGQLINVFGTGVVYPFATLYFYRRVGIAFSLVGIGLLANNLATAGGTILGGTLADRYGRKPVMVASMATSAFTLAAYAGVRTAPGFIAVATAAGATIGLYTPASHAMVADLTSGEERDRAYALLKVANNVGFGSGFVAGGVLFGLLAQSVFVIDGVTSGVVAIVLALTLPRAYEGGEATGVRRTVGNLGRIVTRPRMFAVAVINVGFAIAYAQMQSTVPVFAEGHLGLSSA